MKKGIFLAAPRLVTLESNFISYSFETLVTNFPGEHFDGSRPRFRFCLVSGNFEAGAAVRAGAGLAVVGGSDQRVAVEALGAPLAVVAVGVVEAGALACDGIDTTIGWHFTVIIEVVVSI